MKGDTSKAEAKASAGRVEDRPKSTEEGGRQWKPPAVPSYARQSASAPAGGGAGKIAAGGAAGLVVGTLLGGITATLIAVKSIRKLLTMPFK
jgi:hypothetical protein